MPHLDVYLNSTWAGQLSRDETGRLGFSYREAFLHSPGATPLSRHLPLQAEVFADQATRAFFANLLPEGAVLDQVVRRLGLSRDNIFGLLEQMGGDCAGAVSVFRPGQAPITDGTYRRVTGEELSTILTELPSHPFLADEEGVRLSLAGAQNKLPVFYDGSDFLIPKGEAPSSHILKTAIRELENTVANEAFCMALARAVGVPVPAAGVVELGGAQVYMIERYDRRRLATGQVVRLHQEDFCQALGVVPALKYESEGGPGVRDVFTLVRDWSTEPLPDTEALLRWFLFNFLIGNADAHGKNLSFLYDQGAVRLAPFYDLLSTAAYEGQVNNKFAMRMGNQKDPRYLAAPDLEAFAAQAGIGRRVVSSELKRLADGVALEEQRLADTFAGDGRNRAIVLRISNVIAARAAKARYLLQQPA